MSPVDNDFIEGQIEVLMNEVKQKSKELRLAKKKLESMEILRGLYFENEEKTEGAPKN